MSDKTTSIEPAEEHPYTVALSSAEVVALIKHHIRMTKRVTKVVGDKLLVLQAKSLLPNRRESSAMIEQGRVMVEAHLKRAKGLQSILRK